jgi:hypothetical protein
VLRYGVLNRYDVPTYRRYGYGCVLGLDPDQKIDRDQSSETKLYITPASGKRRERLLTNKRVAKDISGKLRIIKPTTACQDIQPDFIPVSTTRSNKPANSGDDEEEDKEAYRMLQHDNPLDSDTQDELGAEDVDFGSDLTKKNTEFVRRTRERPEDIQAWLDLVDHQEAMLMFDRPTNDLSDAMKSQLGDVRISLYEEALKKVGTDASKRIRLHGALFNEARRSWDAARLDARWKAVLAQYPQSCDLWFAYLDFVQANFTRFKYETCRTTFLECLKAIQHGAGAVSVEDILHVVIRMTRMIHEAGYQELALAIWQALLELHVVKTNAKDMDQLEDLWETEAPRIGEADLSVAALVPLDPSDAIFEGFRRREVDAIEKLRYPGRASDDIGEDDAFHSVFFADIEEYVKVLPTAIPNVLIIEAFLCYCGLPPLSRVAENQRRWWKDPFLQHRTFPRLKSPGDAQDSSHPFVTKLQNFDACPLQAVQMSTELLFQQDFSLQDIRLEPNFLRRILKSATDEIIGQYLLAFELRHFPSDVVKTARQLLKEQPSNQRLYHAYGLVESVRGRSDKANQVFSMALSLGGSPISASESLELFSSWVWEALCKDDDIEALWRQVSPSGQTPTRLESPSLPTAETILQNRAILGGCCEQALLRKDYSAAVNSTTLLALLDYLSSRRFDIDSALTTHQHLSSWFTSHKLSQSPHAELHAQFIARLLTYHVTHAAIVKPKLIRNAIEPLIALFPDNTILLSLYAANEARFAIDDRVRGIMQQTALRHSAMTSAVSWAFAIHYETLRGEIAGSTSHSIRALYKRAVAVDSTGAHCPALWSSYLDFEIAQWQRERTRSANKRPSSSKDGKKRTWETRLEEAQMRVKDAFYQGLRHLPWCKDFIMRAFTTDAMRVSAEEELWKIYHVMQEKELRVYVELE